MENTLGNNQLNKEVKKQKLKKGKEGSILSRRGPMEKVLFAIVFVIFTLYAITLLFPFYYLILNSFKGAYEYIKHLNASSTLSMPARFELENYVEAFVSMNMVNSLGEKVYLPSMFLNSIWYTVAHVGAGILASSLTAYCLAKYNFGLRGFFHGLAIFSMTIPIIGTTGAAFRLYFELKLYNTLLVPLIAGFSGFGMNFLIMYGFFRNLSWSYAEAAFIDGAGHAKVFFSIMMPQAWPPILTLSIMSFIGAWNDYATPLLYMPDFPTIASGIYRIKVSLTRSGDYPVYFAGLVVSMIPVLAIFIGFSKTIMQNFTVGGLKG